MYKSFSHWFFWFCMTVMIMAMLIGALTSCEVLKSKRSATKDSTSVSRVDTSRVIKNEIVNRFDSSWWREIINFLPQSGGDTTIVVRPNIYNQPTPVQIIREGGSISQEFLKRYMDSLNASRKDTTSVRSAEETKSKETKVLSMWQIIGICAGVCLVMIVLSRVRVGIR